MPDAAQLLENPNTHHYWNPTGVFGNSLSNAAGLGNREHQVYAWDVWFLYGPEGKWVGADPPHPHLLMYQLSALRGSAEFPHLDSRALGQQARLLLAQLPPAASATLAS